MTKMTKCNLEEMRITGPILCPYVLYVRLQQSKPTTPACMASMDKGLVTIATETLIVRLRLMWSGGQLQ